HSVKEASAQGLIQQLDQLAASDQFIAQHSIIEISGKCHQCSTRQ
ncbi:MAG: Fur family transcriptional regulator, partial [Acinetobacter junii]